MEMRGSPAHRYAAFAREAADSPCFADWARNVAEDPEVHAWLADLPEAKQQPNLVFAAARWHGAAAPGSYAGLKQVLLEREAAVKETILRRATQTNEVGRLATLVPVLSGLAAEGPLALVEVGASAGLCLYPDRYDYEWPGVGRLVDGRGPLLTAVAEGDLPVPRRHPEVAWRGGCDLHPVDVADADQTAWLSTLVWPEDDERRERLRLAIGIARREPPHLVEGDLFEALPGLLEEAATHGTPVVLHSAVVAYLDDDDRQRFHALMSGLVADRRCRWVSNEGPQVLPQVAATGPAQPAGSTRFVLGLDGRAVAWTHGHGRALTWLPQAGRTP